MQLNQHVSCRQLRCELTHAILHHHEATFVAVEALALEAAGSVDTRAVATQVGGDPALVNIWNKPTVQSCIQPS